MRRKHIYILTAVFLLSLVALAWVFLGRPSATTPVWVLFPDMPMTPYTTDAVYQAFEHGFMVWRGDQNCVYAILHEGLAVIPAEIPSEPSGMLHSYGYCLTIDPLTDKSVALQPPDGLLLPSGVLGKVWRYYTEIRDQLGYAVDVEQRYSALIPPRNLTPVMCCPWTNDQITLPSGDILACGVRAATSGSCNSRQAQEEG